MIERSNGNEEEEEGGDASAFSFSPLPRIVGVMLFYSCCHHHILLAEEIAIAL